MRSTAEKAVDRKAKISMRGAADAYDKLAQEVELKTAPRERHERGSARY
jgi:hypothetical protein